jgi:hypothetical protein
MQQVANRRQLLRLTVVGLGLIGWKLQGLQQEALAATASDPLASARETLKTIILEHAKERDNPWLLIHGIRALGKGFSVGGASALEYLCNHYLQEKSLNGKAYLYMPIDDEGHTNAFLSEAVLDAGVAPDYAFRWGGRGYTIADVVAGAKAMFAFDPASFDRDALAWSLIVFAYTTPPVQDRWLNAYGKPIRFSEVVEFGMATLEEATKRLRAAMRRGTTAAEADSIHDFACAGTHLIYGLATCLRFGYTQRALGDRMKKQFDLLVWRLESDSRLIDRYYQQVATQYPPDLTRIYELDARFKFLGHAFEIINYARLFRLFHPTPVQEEAIRRGQQDLIEVIAAISREDVGKFVADRNLFNLLLGDACHAYHGLAMVRGLNQA